MDPATTNDILDVLPPVPAPWLEPWMTATIVAVALVALALAVWGVVALRRRKHPDPAPSPRAQALRRLRRLDSGIGNLNAYEFGVRVSDILRRYLTDAHRLRATNQTSLEFLRDLSRERRFPEERRGFLERFLLRCDGLKFAPASHAATPNGALLGEALDFVERDDEA